MSEAYICRRGGGSSLNFKVVGGTAQPTGTENLIWVNTDMAISDWVFDVKAPTSPADGMVWIAEGMSSVAGFNMLKKHGVWTYPTGCKQYISGAWIDKTARTYQGGAWVDWLSYIFQSGFGAPDAWQIWRTDTYINASVGTDKISLTGYLRSTEILYILPFTNPGFTTMHCEYTCSEQYSSSGQGGVVGIFSAGYTPSNAAIAPLAGHFFRLSSERVTVAIDISKVASGYIHIRGAWVGAIYNIWFK